MLLNKLLTWAYAVHVPWSIFWTASFQILATVYVKACGRECLITLMLPFNLPVTHKFAIDVKINATGESKLEDSPIFTLHMWGLYAATYKEWHFQFAWSQQFLSSLDVSSLQELFAEVQNPPLRTHVEIHLKLSQPDVTQMLCNMKVTTTTTTPQVNQVVQKYKSMLAHSNWALFFYNYMYIVIVSRENSESEIFMRKSQTEMLPCWLGKSDVSTARSFYEFSHKTKLSFWRPVIFPWASQEKRIALESANQSIRACIT